MELHGFERKYLKKYEQKNDVPLLKRSRLIKSPLITSSALTSISVERNGQKDFFFVPPTFLQRVNHSNVTARYAYFITFIVRQLIRHKVAFVLVYMIVFSGIFRAL